MHAPLWQAHLFCAREQEIIGTAAGTWRRRGGGNDGGGGVRKFKSEQAAVASRRRDAEGLMNHTEPPFGQRAR